MKLCRVQRHIGEFYVAKAQGLRRYLEIFNRMLSLCLIMSIRIFISSDATLQPMVRMVVGITGSFASYWMVVIQSHVPLHPLRAVRSVFCARGKRYNQPNKKVCLIRKSKKDIEIIIMNESTFIILERHSSY